LESGFKAIDKLLLEAQESGDASVLAAASQDAIFLALHFYSLQADAWLGGNAWQEAVKEDLTVPGSGSEDIEKAILRGLAPGAISSEEVRDVVDSLVAATWGKDPFVAFQDEDALPSMSTAVSAFPQFAAFQLSIGMLWGFALRGLAMRLALDRALGTMPESTQAARQRLERALADEDGDRSKAKGAEDQPQQEPPTLQRYASEFFGHRDWAALCKVSDASVGVMETELEEALPALAFLAHSSDLNVKMMLENDEVEEFDTLPFDMQDDRYSTEDDDDDDDDLEEGIEQMIYLPLEAWESLQRRSLVIGALLADAEAFVDQQVGPLHRGRRPGRQWVDRLIRSGALTNLRWEQAQSFASTLNMPLQRLVEVLRSSVLTSKLQTAREGLSKLYDSNPMETSSGNSTSNLDKAASPDSSSEGSSKPQR
jgi:hypothetical protein